MASPLLRCRRREPFEEVREAVSPRAGERGREEGKEGEYQVPKQEMRTQMKIYSSKYFRGKKKLKKKKRVKTKSKITDAPSARCSSNPFLNTE